MIHFISVTIETFHNYLYREHFECDITVDMYLKYLKIMFRKYIQCDSKINVSKLT